MTTPSMDDIEHGDLPQKSRKALVGEDAKIRGFCKNPWFFFQPPYHIQ